MKFNRISRCFYVSDDKKYSISKDYTGWAIFARSKDPYNDTYYRCAEYPTFNRLKDCLKYFNAVVTEK